MVSIIGVHDCAVKFLSHNSEVIYKFLLRRNQYKNELLICRLVVADGHRLPERNSNFCEFAPLGSNGSLRLHILRGLPTLLTALSCAGSPL